MGVVLEQGVRAAGEAAGAAVAAAKRKAENRKQKSNHREQSIKRKAENENEGFGSAIPVRHLPRTRCEVTGGPAFTLIELLSTLDLNNPSGLCGL